MNKLFTKLIYICLLLIISNTLFAQCSTNIFTNKTTIACGESLFLQQSGVGGTSSDDFSSGTLSGLWQNVTFGWSLTSPCGTNPLGAQHLFFAQGSTNPRAATTNPVDASCGGDVCFDFKMETQSPPPCDGPDLPGEGVYLQYSINSGASWNTIHYFDPATYNFAGWNNYCHPMPAAAQTSSTMFRWYQDQISSPVYDLWGIDNINISTCTGYQTVWFGGAISGYTGDTVTVSPNVTDSIIYSIMYTDFATDTCYDSITIHIEMPTIVATQTPAPCAGSTQLNALATIPANCNYTFELWDGAGDGWNAGGNPPQYHNMDIMINNSLYGNLTMLNGAGPQTHLIPVTDGDTLETFLQNWGTNYADCGYVIRDSQGNIVRLDGLPPVSGNPPVGSNLGGNSLPAIFVSCPTTLFYNYSWATTAGTVTGLSNPNIFDPTVTVGTTTDYVVTGYDAAHPWCIATDTVTVLANNATITANFSGPAAICSGNPVTLSFLPMVGIANWTLTLNINSVPTIFTLDGSGNDINTGLPLTFYPVTTTTYDVVSLIDGTGCPAAVNNPSITVNVNGVGSAGTSGSITVCETDNFFDLFNILTGNPSLGGTWTNSAGTILPSSFYNPATTGSDIFTYTVYGTPPCGNDFSMVSVTNNSLPDAGQNATYNVCLNDPAFNMENFLAGTPQAGGTWSDVNNNIVSNLFDPSTMSSGVYTYTVPGLSPCPSNSANLTVNVNPLPTASISTTTPTICNGNVGSLNFNLTGTAPFDITYNDGTSNSTQTINTLTGSVVVTPSTSTTYTLISIIDGNGCSSLISGNVTITVTPGGNAGTNGSISVCENSAIFDLFTQLNGTPDVGGSWTDGSSNPISNIFNPATFSPGNYTLTYTINNPPCIPVTADVDVTINPIVDAGSNGVHTVCENDAVFNLFNYLNGSPDPGGTWTDINNIPVPNMFNPSTSGSGTFTYTYTVLGVSPCIDASADVTVTVDPLPTVTIGGSTTITQGMNTPLNFNFTGNAPFTLVYDDGNGPITPPSFNSNNGIVNVSPNMTTTYTIISVTDANGCVSNTSGSATITVNQLPTVSLSGNNTICNGDITPLEFILGGAPNFTIRYNVNGVLDSCVLNNVGANNLNVNPSTTTTYSLVSITDGNGVTENNVSGTVTINVNPLPSASISGNNTICIGEQSSLIFTLTGSPNYNLTYNPGGISVTLDANGNDINTGNPVIVSPNSTTIYDIVSITDANNCTNIGSGTASITVNPLPTISIGGTSPICAGQSSDLTFSLTGNPPYNINYLDNGNPVNITLDALGTVNGTPVNVTPSNTSSYDLIDITDANNCSSVANGSFIVIVDPLPTVTMNGASSICLGETKSLNFNFTGTAPFNINYSVNNINNSAVLNNNVDSIIISPITNTTYEIIDVTDANCSNIANGDITIIVNPLPSATISGGAVLCADGSTTQIEINPSGNPPYNIIYSDGFNNVTLNNISSTQNIETNTAGNYSLVSIIDVNGCSGTVSGIASVIVNPLPIANFSFMPQPADINNPTIYFTDLSSGHITGIYDYGDGISEPTTLGGEIAHTYTDTGKYQVLFTVNSIDGCSTTVSHTIIIDPAFMIYIPNAFSPNRDGRNDVFTPVMMGVDEYQIYIYDRFGQLIYETDNMSKGWDGTINGGDFATAGHYAYAVRIIDLLGKKQNLTGSFTLIR